MKPLILVSTGVQRSGQLMTYFDQETENQIDFSFTVGGYENIAEVNSTGLELTLNYELTDNILASYVLTSIARMEMVMNSFVFRNSQVIYP